MKKTGEKRSAAVERPEDVYKRPMYELASDLALNEDRSVILQPLFNASIVTTRMAGYRESGSAGNAGLKVEDQELTTAAVAVGARLSGLMGSVSYTHLPYLYSQSYSPCRVVGKGLICFIKYLIIKRYMKLHLPLNLLDAAGRGAGKPCRENGRTLISQLRRKTMWSN